MNAWALLVFVCNSTDSKQLRICEQGQKPQLRRVLSFDNFLLLYVHMLLVALTYMLAS